jgi:hypothetical protein
MGWRFFVEYLVLHVIIMPLAPKIPFKALFLSSAPPHANEGERKSRVMQLSMLAGRSFKVTGRGAKKRCQFCLAAFPAILQLYKCPICYIFIR